METPSALVVLRVAEGELTGDERITSENVARFLPSPAAVAETSAFFRDSGFEVTETVGISFSITGPPEAFERVFGEAPEVSVEGGVERARTRSGLELDVGRLPAAVRRHVQTVTFTPPPAFGPTQP